MIVHHVEVNDVRARGEHVINFFAKPGKIGGRMLVQFGTWRVLNRL